jgi:AcrR family transcriptional regulator
MGKNSKKAFPTQIKSSKLVQKRHLHLAKNASKLFIKKGYFKTTIREIAKDAGFTLGNLYDYITKKEDILYLVINTFHSIWVSRLNEEGIFEIEDPVEQLRTAIQKMLELVNENENMVLLAYRESKTLPKKFLKMVLEKEVGLVECFEKILKNGIEKGIFKDKDPFFLANIIVYLFVIEPLRGWNLKKRYNIQEINNLIEEFILQNVLKRELKG